MSSSYNRKYYLHNALKAIGINVKGKTISITEEKYSCLRETSKAKLFELQRCFNYSVQFELPSKTINKP